jgi:hypothetical protein
VVDVWVCNSSPLISLARIGRHFNVAACTGT